jgi:hypothetical protein
MSSSNDSMELCAIDDSRLSIFHLPLFADVKNGLLDVCLHATGYIICCPLPLKILKAGGALLRKSRANSMQLCS